MVAIIECEHYNLKILAFRNPSGIDWLLFTAHFPNDEPEWWGLCAIVLGSYVFKSKEIDA